MNARELRRLVEQVHDGSLSRRSFMHRMAALGLSAPMASMMLMHEGLAQSAPSFTYKGNRRGGGGALKLLLWQGPTLLNPHLASGAKDQEGSRPFYEPLARYDHDGKLEPVLCAEIPSRQNGGIAADGLSTTWTLKSRACSGTTVRRSLPTMSSSTGCSPPIRRPAPSRRADTPESRPSRRSTRIPRAWSSKNRRRCGVEARRSS